MEEQILHEESWIGKHLNEGRLWWPSGTFQMEMSLENCSRFGQRCFFFPWGMECFCLFYDPTPRTISHKVNQWNADIGTDICVDDGIDAAAAGGDIVGGSNTLVALSMLVMN